MTARAPTAAEALRTARKAAGKTMEELARAIGCSKTLLSHMEAGQRTISIERARAIEKALKIRDGRIVAAVQWDQTPPEIRQSMTRTQHRNRAMALGLKHALASGNMRELRKIVRQSAADEAPDDSLPLRGFRGIPLINKV